MRKTLMQLGQRRCTAPVDTVFQHHRMQRPSSAQIVYAFAWNAGVRSAPEGRQLLESTERHVSTRKCHYRRLMFERW